MIFKVRCAFFATACIFYQTVSCLSSTFSEIFDSSGSEALHLNLCFLVTRKHSIIERYLCQQEFSYPSDIFLSEENPQRSRRDLNPRAGFIRPTPLAGAPLRPLEYYSKLTSIPAKGDESSQTGKMVNKSTLLRMPSYITNKFT